MGCQQRFATAGGYAQTHARRLAKGRIVIAMPRLRPKSLRHAVHLRSPRKTYQHVKCGLLVGFECECGHIYTDLLTELSTEMYNARVGDKIRLHAV